MIINEIVVRTDLFPRTDVWQFDDGGRAAAGFKGTTQDCVCRAISIATEKPYQEVYSDINELGQKERNSKLRAHKSNARLGVHAPTMRRYLISLGWEWAPTMHIGSGTTVHLKADELPSGRLIVQVSKHVTAMINGTIHDTFDPSRDGTRCVYGYFTRP